jgi:hypothetical protein
MANTLTLLYFFINTFIAGMFFQEERKFTKKWHLAISTLEILLFGGIYFVWSNVLSPLIKLIDNTFQIRFLFKFFVLGAYRNTDKELLEKLNKRFNRSRPRGIRQRLEKYCMNLVNKRNGTSRKTN